MWDVDMPSPVENGKVLFENLQFKKFCQILTSFQRGKRGKSNFTVEKHDQHCLRQVTELISTMTSHVGRMYTCHNVMGVTLHVHGLPCKDPLSQSNHQKITRQTPVEEHYTK